MSDRELLEAAAKAAGYQLSSVSEMIWSDTLGEFVLWNPLTDDGDALRLAVKLKMTVDITDEASGAGAIGLKWCSEPYKDDPYAATRRAIVRAAAEIGRSMK
jgi:hypothetical protein